MVLFIMREKSLIMDNIHQCTSKEICVPYISIYRKRTNFVVAPPKSLNGTAGISSTSELKQKQQGQ